MKNIAPFLFLLLCIATPPTLAQWQWSNPAPEGNEMFDASFITGTKGWAVGGNGAILSTTDRGATWSSQMNPLRTTPFIGLNVVFVDQNTGLISSNNGTLVRTSDGGNVWSVLPSPGVSIQKLRKAPDGSIWGFGSLGALARSTDVGRTWTIMPTNILDVVFDVAFPSPSVFVAVCGGGIVLRTTDAGGSWSKTTLSVTSDIVSVDFVSATKGFAVQKSKYLLRTTDGGATWADTTIFVNSLRTVRFADAQTGWVLSNGTGTVLKTSNGGLSWAGVAIDTSFRYSFQNVVTFGPDAALFLGEGGAVFYTANGGTTIQQQGSAVTREHLYGVTSLGASEAWVFGNRTVMRSTDNGVAWSANLAGGRPIHCGVAISSTRIVAGGTQGEMYLSTNGGQSWSAQTLPSLGQVERIVFVDASTGWLAGNHGTIARTTDGGVTWVPSDPGMTDDFHGVTAVSAQEAWIAGNSGKILHTTNGGQSWTPQTTNTLSSLYAIQFISPSIGFAGGQMILLTTLDGGQTWTPKTLPGLDVVYDLSFRTATSGIVLLSRGVTRTTDGGASFYRTDYPSTNLRALSFTAGGIGTLVGDFGVLMRYKPAAAVLLDPSTLDFGSVPINKSKNMDITIQNSGELPLVIANATVLGNGFTLVGIASNTLAPGERTKATVRFAPPDTLTFRGLATVISNALIGLTTVDLVGRGIPPLPSAIIHTPAIVDFGKVKLGTIRLREISIQNRSGMNLMVDDERISGGDSAQFQIGRMSRLAIQAFAFDSIQAVFGPQQPGVFSSTLYILTNDPAEPVYGIPLKGEAINAEATCTPATVPFGFVLIDSTETRQVTVRNSGTDTLKLYKGYTQNGDATEFSVGAVPSGLIPPGASVVVDVRFTPRSYGPKSSTLVLETNDKMNPGSYVQLIGRATTLDAPRPSAAPLTATLSQNAPNPVALSRSPIAQYTVTLPSASDIRVTIYDMLGREIAERAEHAMPSGTHDIRFDLRALAPGQYVAVLTATRPGGAAFRTAVITTVIR
jgi:photosystem II stability/assembly factor-like uncharacterized protein